VRFKLRSGHAGGHLRDAFWEAVDALMAWEENEPMPIVLVGDWEILLPAINATLADDDVPGNVT
jgi:hypothetical protein